ncbi:ABC transporter ATP-binding protein [Phreatobacter stygius]|uniref:ABC transporter ATP-binding protein n=1 Tax=Phreatobacter stygius TaxID=1940610 RepID=A0A4D7AT91_9HYPH|nr:ABC transporter ATP-binding protein [Phreatobacter stygius]QCI64744.1 ABC transporter ATP-binding protein [Phreatobacter stygius]
MTGRPLLEIRHLSKNFGGLVATSDVSLEVRPGETLALIGPNGAGKTTLIAQLQGELRPSSGAILFRGRDITHMPPQRRASLGLARSFQITAVLPDFTALENVRLAVQARSGHSFRFWRSAAGDASLDGPAGEALDQVGLGARRATRADALSHGEQRQLELAIALAMKPALLLLDEPMAGIGRQDAAAMTALLRNLKRSYSIVLVEHDMNAVFALADRVAVLVAGAVIAVGAPDAVRADPAVRAAYLGHTS